MLGKLLARNPYPKVARAVPQSGQGRTPKWPGPYPKVARAVPQRGQGRTPKWPGPYPKVARAVPQSGQGRTPKWPGPYPKVARAGTQTASGRTPIRAASPGVMGIGEFGDRAPRRPSGRTGSSERHVWDGDRAKPYRAPKRPP